MDAELATGALSGHVAFLRELEDFLADSGDSELALLIAQVQDLSRINNNFGYRVGEALCEHLGTQFAAMLRSEDWTLRLNEGTFAIVLPNVKNQGHATLAANKILRIVAESRDIGDHRVDADVSIGIARFPDLAEDAEDLLKNAEVALESAKQAGQAYAVYSPKSSVVLEDQWALETDIDKAIKNDEFSVVYQPQVRTSDLSPCGAEVLLRWKSPQLGPVSPDRFIPLCDETDRIEAVTNFALNTALRETQQWPDSAKNVSVSVNITPYILQNPGIVENVKQATAIWGIDPSRLVLEITENGLMRDAEQNFRVMEKLRDCGVRLAIDDFGTGYSSFAYFKNIPADELKIDKSFVLNMIDDFTNLRLVRAIIDLAHSFGLTVVAEGVENLSTVKALDELGCDVIQGHHFAEPLRQTEFISWLEAQSKPHD